MITKEYPISVPVSFLEKTGISPETCLFFDIETTGLSWRRSHLYLLGAVFYTPEGWLQKQWFCQRPGEEKDLLEIFSSLLEQKKTLIHFNGNTFDIPYLMHKSTFYQMELNWDGATSLDLYQKLLPFKKLLGLEHMRQKDLERYLGRSREDLFSGGELISLYQEYLKTADERLLSVLLLHNREDVSEMTGLLPLLELSRLFSGSWEGTVEAQVTPDLQLLLKPAVSLSLPLDFTYDASCCQLSAHQGKLTLDIPSGYLKIFLSRLQKLLLSSFRRPRHSQKRRRLRRQRTSGKSKGIHLLPEADRAIPPTIFRRNLSLFPLGISGFLQLVFMG